jgi:chromate transporter
MLLPGPEAHQLAVYIGWLTGRIRGGVLAGALFVAPGLVTLGILSWLQYAGFGQIGAVGAVFFGLKSAVLAIVLEAVIRIGRRALKSQALVTIAALAFVGIFVFALPFPLIIASAALAGYIGRKFSLDWFKTQGHAGKGDRENDATALRSSPG